MGEREHQRPVRPQDPVGLAEHPGEVDDLAEEMRRAAEEIGRGELDRELLERQERIVGRMLESQRALERRGYSRERRSETAGDVPAAAAPPLAPGADGTEAILELIRSAMRERGPVAYEDLVREYFRALSRKVRGEGER